MRATTALTAAFVIALVALIVSPYTLSYVTSDSMSPTIEPGDAFLLGPSDGVTEGEIITYHSPVKSGYVTHRAVKVTEHGIITKGDANEVTDQAGSEPPVTPDRIRGEVVTVAGSPLVVPGAGGPLRTLLENRILVALSVLLLVVLDVARGLTSRRSSRGVTRRGHQHWWRRTLIKWRLVSNPDRGIGDGRVTTGNVINWVAAGTFVLGVVLVAFGGSTHTIDLVATAVASSSSGPTVPVSETVVRSVTYRSAAPGYVHSVVDTAHGTVLGQQALTDAYRVRVEVGPYPTPGVYQLRLSATHYPLTLPPKLIEYLHAVHPIVAATATVGILVAPYYLLVRALVPARLPIRIRLPASRRRDGP